MGTSRSWFGKKEPAAPSFLIGSSRYMGSSGPSDPQFAWSSQQQSTVNQQGRTQAQDSGDASPAPIPLPVPNQDQTSGLVTNNTKPGSAPLAPSNGPSAQVLHQPHTTSTGTSSTISGLAPPSGSLGHPGFVSDSSPAARPGDPSYGPGISKENQLYPMVDSRGRATVGQGGQASSQLYPQIGGNRGGGSQGGPAPGVTRYTERSGWVGPGEGATVVAQTGLEVGPAGKRPVEAHEEELVRIPGAMVHLIGGEASLLLTAGDLRVVRITQEGAGMVAIVRVGEDMQWPLGWDEPVFKIDPNHYVFTLRLTEGVEGEPPQPPNPSLAPGSSDFEVTAGSSDASEDGRTPPGATGRSGEEAGEAADVLSYGVTFTDGVPTELGSQLDACLQRYSVFSEPDAVARAGVGGATAATTPGAVPPVASHPGEAGGAAQGSSGPPAGPPAVLSPSPSTVRAAAHLAEASAAAAREGAPPAVGRPRRRRLTGRLREDAAGLVVPTDPEERQLAEQSAEYWTTIAPDVEEYRGTVARGIASGSGGLIKGILCVSRHTSQGLERMGTFVKGRLPAGDPHKPTHISPAMMRSMQLARSLSRMTAKVADGILAGVVTATGFVAGKVLKYTYLGTAVSKVVPGEVAIVSLEAFDRVFDAVEAAGKNILQTTSVVTSGVVTHRYGNEAGQLASQGLAATGHMIQTAWTVSKLRKALLPTKVVKTALMNETMEGVKKAAKSRKD